MASLTAQRAKHLFVQLAFQYHVAGRLAVIDGLSPVCGNLLHHAVEMALKAALTDVLTLPDLKKLNHSLPKIWGAFTSSFPDADISVLNQAIAQLDRFEDLRYPDYVLANGATIRVALFREHIIPDQSGKPCVEPSTPEFLLVLEDIDGLLELVLEKAQINPPGYIASMSRQAREHLSLHNRHASRF